MTAPRRFASLADVSPRRAEIRHADHRGETRVFSGKEAVALHFRGCSRIAPVLNRSANGLLLRLATALRVGEEVGILFPGGQRREAVVRWFHSEKVGIRLL